MQPLIEFLNLWGPKFLAYAGAVLWQSSVLILLLLAIDLAFRRKLAPGVRYALWSLLFVKLLLPPSFALPTSPAWWLRTHQEATTPPPQTRVLIVTSNPSEKPSRAAIPPTKLEFPAP